MSKRLIDWGIFVLLCLIWGSSFILMKKSQVGLTGGQIAALRICSAGFVCVPFAVFHLPRIPRQKIGLVLLLGLFGNLLPAFCFAIAIFKIDSSLAGILNSLTPLCVAIIAITFFKDKISSRKMIGILVGFGGLCLLALTQGRISLNNWGFALLIFAATLMYGINVNLVGHYLKTANPVHLTTVSLSFMAILSAIVLWQLNFFQVDFAVPVIQRSIVNACLLGILASSIATIIFYMLVQRAGGLFASLVTYGTPFVALFWGAVYGENINVLEILALCIILLGVYLANRKN